jgi:hypothetical protein
VQEGGEMNKIITIFDAPIAEFKTQKAAIKFAKRVMRPVRIVKAERSLYDWCCKKPVYHVVLEGN